MAVRVITLDAVTQPEDLLHSEIITEPLLDLLAGHGGVPVGMKQARLRGEEGSCPVGIDGPSLQDERRLEKRETEMAGYPGRDDIIIIKGRVLPSPCIVAEIIHGQRGSPASLHKNRTMVAAPWLVGGIVVKLDALHGSRFGEQSPHLPLLFRRGDIHPQDLGLGKHCGHADKGRYHAVIAVGKTLPPCMRPGDPCRLMPLPLRGHGIAQGARGLCSCRHNQKLRWEDESPCERNS